MGYFVVIALLVSNLLLYDSLKFNMARDVHDVVKGILPLFSGHAFVLFGSCAVHSFVSSTCVKFCAEVPMPLDCTLTVATPVGDHICEVCQMGKQAI